MTRRMPGASLRQGMTTATKGAFVSAGMGLLMRGIIAG